MVEGRESGITYKLEYVNQEGVRLVSRHGCGDVSYRELLDDYTRPGVIGDGSPCGIVEDDQ